VIPDFVCKLSRNYDLFQDTKTPFINAISPFVGAPHGTPSNPLSLGEKGEPDVFWLQKKFLCGCRVIWLVSA
jgi:hypothetical protein